MGLRVNICEPKPAICSDQLHAYASRFPVWDPMLTYDGQRWFLYLLSTPRPAGKEDFFTRDNFIRGFVSHDLRTWQDLGTVIQSGFYGKRICAGSVVHENDKFHFFCSATTEQFSSDLLDQRVFLATSVDGVTFELDDAFALEPDPDQYGTCVYYPGTGKMMYAWRDPYVFRDPLSGKYYLYICAGGRRWGTPPKIGVAVADCVQGPFRLLAPAAIAAFSGPEGKQSVPLWEMERVQVVYRNGQYLMMFSVWEHFMDAAWKELVARNKAPLAGSATVILRSDSPTGPFLFDENAIVIDKPPGRNLYGAMLVSSPAAAAADFVVGWYPQNFKPEVSADLRIDWDRQMFATV